MDQNETPIVDALAALERHSVMTFGAPGHGQGRAMPPRMARLIGKRAFEADVLTPKGLDDRTESKQALQRAHEIAAVAWGADICRFATGGSTQSLHTAVAALAQAGDTVIIAQNAHKAEFSVALFAGLNPVVVPVTIDVDWDLEHGVSAAALAATLAAHPHAKAVVVVNPTYYGVTCDIAALAGVCHARGVPLVVDAAWGSAFGFCSRLPANPLTLGADVMVCSLHKTMGALAQGSAMFARGNLVDQQRFALAYELFETTSPSVPILASLDATRRDHALGGEAIWGDVLDLAAEARAGLAAIPGVAVLARDRLDGDGAFDMDESRVTMDIARLGVSGYAADDWLYEHHGINVGLSDGRHLLAAIAPGTTRHAVHALVRAVADMVDKLRADPAIIPAAPQDLPRVGTLGFELAMPCSDAFFADVEMIRYEDATDRVAAELIAPAPPGVPRLIPGQRISAAHVAYLVANRDAGMFVLDPTDPAERRIRVVR